MKSFQIQNIKYDTDEKTLTFFFTEDRSRKCYDVDSLDKILKQMQLILEKIDKEDIEWTQN